MAHPPETLALWIARFLDARIATETPAASTLKAYRQTLQRLARFMEARGLQRWEEATPSLLQDFLEAETVRRGGSPSAWNQRLAVLRAFFAFLQAQGRVAENPASGFPWRSPRRPVRFPLPPAQRERLRTAAERLPETPVGLRDRLILDLIAHLGLRAGQAIALVLEDVGPDGADLRIPGRRGPRRVALPEPVRASLRRYLAHGRPALARDPGTRALLLNHRGGPLTRQGLWWVIKALARRAGLPPEALSPERLRPPAGLPLELLPLEGGQR